MFFYIKVIESMKKIMDGAEKEISNKLTEMARNSENC